jgi:hypothetical protein
LQSWGDKSSHIRDSAAGFWRQFPADPPEGDLLVIVANARFTIANAASLSILLGLRAGGLGMLVSRDCLVRGGLGSTHDGASLCVGRLSSLNGFQFNYCSERHDDFCGAEIGAETARILWRNLQQVD